jgi:hypothetical protein
MVRTSAVNKMWVFLSYEIMKCQCHRHLSWLGDKRKCLLNFGWKTSGKAHMWKMKHNIEYSRTVNFTLMTRHLEGWQFVQSS